MIANVFWLVWEMLSGVIAFIIDLMNSYHLTSLKKCGKIVSVQSPIF